MHFDDDKCALCGKKLGKFPELDDFNKDGRPYLCSQKCHDVIGRVSEYDPHYNPPPDPDSFHEVTWEFQGGNKFYEDYEKNEKWRVNHETLMIAHWRREWRRDWQTLKDKVDEQTRQELLALEAAKPKMPDEIPYRIRFEHTHVLAGSGAGKTNLLTHQLMADVFDPRQPALIVIDGKGTWAPALQRFACFAPDRAQSERLVVINPQDKQHPPALNMFSAHETLVDGVAENLAYIFGSREFELSAKQRTAFTYAAQLVFSMPNPTIETLLALMQDPVEKTGGVPSTSKFREAIDRQPHINRRFFNELFYHPTEFLETKRQIQNRIYDLLGSRAFAAMFTREENRLDMHDIMQNGKILIVDASPGAVGDKAASTFGRYIILLALSTARSRIELPRTEWRPTFLYIDEAQLFVDEERTQPLLQQAREFNLGVILSHQKLADLTPTLRATFAGNTSSKYCGNPSADDARDMAKEMHTDGDFIRSLKHQDGHAHFAAYIRGMTDSAVSHRFKLGTMEDTPKMSDTQYAQLMRRNGALMSPPVRLHTKTPASIAQPTTHPIAQPDTPSGKAKGFW